MADSASLLLNHRLPQVVSLILHLRNKHSPTGIDSSVESGDKGGEVLLSGAAVILDLVYGTIQGGDGLSRLLLSLGHDDSVAGNLVLEGAGNLAQGTEGVARVLLARALQANSVVASLAVGVDFHANVLLAAGYPLHLHFPFQRIVKRNQLVGGRHLQQAM